MFKKTASQFLRTLFFALCVGLAASAQTSIEAQYNLATLGQDTFDRLAGNDLKFQVAVLRANPSLLDETRIMRYFILINNCHETKDIHAQVDPRIVKALDNELDYPKISAYYKERAQPILDGLKLGPLTVMIDGPRLGSYDTAKHEFPFIQHIPRVGPRSGFIIAGYVEMGTGGGDKSLLNVCFPASFENSTHHLFERFSVELNPMNFSGLPMDEADARKYIESTEPNFRSTLLKIDLDLTAKPQVDLNPRSGNIKANFPADIKGVTILKAQSRETLGVLYPSRN